MDLLFSKGKSFHATPIKLMCLLHEEPTAYPALAMFVVPKRAFKKAHDRNRLKRRMREVYRLHKYELYTAMGTKKGWLAFIYTGTQDEAYATIEVAMQKVLGKFLKI